MADCLKRVLGLCCEPCECLKVEKWQEGTALAVRGREVITDRGTVTVRAGNVTQPGQTVLMTAGGRTAGSRPQHRGRDPRPDEPAPVPLPPAYDTPQRPGLWRVATTEGGEE